MDSASQLTLPGQHQCVSEAVRCRFFISLDEVRSPQEIQARRYKHTERNRPEQLGGSAESVPRCFPLAKAEQSLTLDLGDQRNCTLIAYRLCCFERSCRKPSGLLRVTQTQPALRHQEHGPALAEGIPYVGTHVEALLHVRERAAQVSCLMADNPYEQADFEQGQ
jgi:hypothetical protein